MRKVALFLIFAGCLPGQKWQDLLLPQAQHILGIVGDEDGKPVLEARVDHAEFVRPQLHQTDSQGKFELTTQAPALVIRKAGFESAFVLTNRVTEIRITLRTAHSGVFPTCSSSGTYEGIEGWGASFQFPRTAGVKASTQGRDIDYGAREYYVNTQQGRKAIRHGSGPMWSFGIPTSIDVWKSAEYREVAYSAGRQSIVDAHGKQTDGNRWRYLGKFGESASYSDVDEATAKILDQFLDGACLKTQAK
jgi:hypothetical protein